MRWSVALRIGLVALRRNRMRTALTVLGMIIGVAAVISIAALGAGARETIEDRRLPNEPVKSASAARSAHGRAMSWCSFWRRHCS